MMRTFATITLLLLLGALAACASRKTYPDSAPGWHSADYAVVFGRLQLVPAKNADDPPGWLIRYGFSADDAYGGRFNLTPITKMTGYNGGELVEIRGHRLAETTQPGVSGTLYQVDSIRLWLTTKPQ